MLIDCSEIDYVDSLNLRPIREVQRRRVPPCDKLAEFVPSIVSRHVPLPAPVVTCSVADVDDTAVNVPAVTLVVPVRLLVIVTVLPPVHVVAVPTSVNVMGLA